MDLFHLGQYLSSHKILSSSIIYFSNISTFILLYYNLIIQYFLQYYQIFKSVVLLQITLNKSFYYTSLNDNLQWWKLVVKPLVKISDVICNVTVCSQLFCIPLTNFLFKIFRPLSSSRGEAYTWFFWIIQASTSTSS